MENKEKYAIDFHGIQAKSEEDGVGVTLNGTGIEILKCFSALVDSMHKKMPDFVIRAAFEMGMSGGKARSDSERSAHLES